VVIKEKEYGLDHPSVAMELNNLAVLYCHLVSMLCTIGMYVLFIWLKYILLVNAYFNTSSALYANE